MWFIVQTASFTIPLIAGREAPSIHTTQSDFSDPITWVGRIFFIIFISLIVLGLIKTMEEITNEKKHRERELYQLQQSNVCKEGRRRENVYELREVRDRRRQSQSQSDSKQTEDPKLPGM